MAREMRRQSQFSRREFRARRSNWDAYLRLFTHRGGKTRGISVHYTRRRIIQLCEE